MSQNGNGSTTGKVITILGGCITAGFAFTLTQFSGQISENRSDIKTNAGRIMDVRIGVEVSNAKLDALLNNQGLDAKAIAEKARDRIKNRMQKESGGS